MKRTSGIKYEWSITRDKSGFNRDGSERERDGILQDSTSSNLARLSLITRVRDASMTLVPGIIRFSRSRMEKRTGQARERQNAEEERREQGTIVPRVSL